MSLEKEKTEEETHDDIPVAVTQWTWV